MVHTHGVGGSNPSLAIIVIYLANLYCNVLQIIVGFFYIMGKCGRVALVKHIFREKFFLRCVHWHTLFLIIYNTVIHTILERHNCYGKTKRK